MQQDFFPEQSKHIGKIDVQTRESKVPYLETAFQDFFGLGATDCAVDGDFLVTTDAEGPDGVSCLREDWNLAGKRLQNLGGPGQPIARLADANVQAELANLDVPHGILRLLV